MPLLNLNALYKHIELRLGLKGLQLPVDKNDIIDNIKQESLITFSQFFPNHTMLEIDLETDKLSQYIYRIPIEKLEKDNIYLLSVLTIARAESNAYGNPNYYGRSMEELFDLQMASDVISMEDDFGTVFELLPPNKLKVDKVPSYNTNGKFKIECAVTHAQNLATIKPSMANAFKKLAVLDTKILLWELLKRYATIQSTYGEINLHIDNWESAEGEREDLLDRWEDDSLADAKYRIFAY